MNNSTSTHSNALTKIKIDIDTFLAPHDTEPTGKEKKKDYFAG